MVDLKKLRKELNLKQSELAELLGVNQSTISWIENGRSELSGQMYNMLKERFGEDVISKLLETTSNVNANSVNIGSAVGNNNHIGMVDGLKAMLKDYQDTIADLRSDKEDLKATIKELKETINMYREKYGTLQ